MKTILRISFVVVLLCLFALPVQAQDKEKNETPYWYYSFLKFESYDKVNEFQKFHEEAIVPIVEEAKNQGTLLDYKFLRHHTGDEYNIVVARKHPSWCSITANWREKALDAIEKDEDKKKAFWDKYSELVNTMSHYDCIYIQLY